jgi:hypothetical protein
MSEELHDIDDLFRRSIEEYEDMPSDKVWSAIDKDLDLQNDGNVSDKYIYIKRAAAVILLLLIGTLIYNLSNRNFFNTDKHNVVNVQNKIKSENQEIKKIPATVPETSNSINKKTDTQINRSTEKTDNVRSGNETLHRNVYDSPEKGGSNITESANKDLVNKERVIKSKLSRKISAKTSVIITKMEDDVIAETNENTIFDNTIDRTPAGLITMTKKSAELIPLNDRFIFPKEDISKNDHKKLNKVSPFSVTPFFSPNIVKMYLRNNEKISSSADLHEINEGEYENLSFSAGALADYSINKKWNLQSGLVYNSFNYLINPKKLFAQLDDNGNIKYKFESSAGYLYVTPKIGTSPAIGDSTYTNETTAILNYIAVPLSIKYNIPFRKFNFFISAGPAINILLNGKVKTEIEGSNENEIVKSNDIYGLRTTYFSGNITAGASYKMTNRLSFTLFPSYNFAITPINKNCPVKSYPNALGLAGGLQYKF